MIKGKIVNIKNEGTLVFLTIQDSKDYMLSYTVGIENRMFKNLVEDRGQKNIVDCIVSYENKRLYFEDDMEKKKP